MVLFPEFENTILWQRVARALRVVALACVALAAMPAAAEQRVVIGAEDDWYPFSGVVNGQLRGMGVDIVRAAFAATGVNIELDVVPYARCLELTRQGKYVACFDTVRNRVTEADFQWPHAPLFRPEIGIYAHRLSGEHGVNVGSLAGKRVAVTRAYEYGEAFDTMSGVDRIVTDRDAYGFRMLAARRADYMLAYVRVADYVLAHAAKDVSDQIVLVGMAAQVDIYLAFSRTHPQAGKYLDLFERGFAMIERDGTWRAIEKRWATANR